LPQVFSQVAHRVAKAHAAHVRLLGDRRGFTQNDYTGTQPRSVYFIFLNFGAPEKKRTARCGSSFRSCLRNRRFQRPS